MRRLSAACLALGLAGVALAAAPGGRHVIVRDFRTVKDGRCVNFNIGTAAHGPSSVAQVLKYMPGTRVTVWADAPLSDEMAAMMRRRFPDVPVVWGNYGPNASPELKAAVASADALLIGSSSGLFGKVLSSARDFRRVTGRLVGCAAMGTPNPAYREFDFGWFRDEKALAAAEKTGDVAPLHGYAPDSVFDFDCTDEEGAAKFLRANGLERGRFVCAIPGNRVTPRWEFWGTKPDEKGLALNARTEEADNAVLRAAIVEVVRRHGLKVLVCAEQIPEVALGKRLVMDRLPDDVRARCVWTGEYWSPDLALSVCRASRLVFGIEMHSQVMALGNGVPSVILVHPNFGTKDDMWRTIGCADWRVDLTAEDAASRAVRTVSSILSDERAARAKVAAAREFLDRKASEMFASSFALGLLGQAKPETAACPVRNFRDMGGVRGRDGRRVRTGRIFRSAAFDDISEAGRAAFLAETKVRTDVDLRYKEELRGRTDSALGIAWTNVPSQMYDDMVKPYGRPAFAQVFDLALHEENYPMVIHCRGGRDRTGSIVIAFNALLGVGEDDLYADWCKTDGADPAKRPREEVFEKLLASFADYPGETLSERVAAFVLDAGEGRFTAADLKRFEALMLEPKRRK